MFSFLVISANLLQFYLKYFFFEKSKVAAKMAAMSLNAGGGGVLGSSFAGYVPLASQNPYPIIVYSVASYRPHLSHFWANIIVISRTEFNASRLFKILKQQQESVFNRESSYF